MLKITLNVKGPLKCWLWHMARLLWAKHKFNSGLNGLRQTLRRCQWRYSSFSSITMAWRIMNSWYKVVRSIRNTTLKLCADCAKQFVRNEQNCRKSIMDLAPWWCTSSHIDACAWVFGQTQNCNHVSTFSSFQNWSHRWK